MAERAAGPGRVGRRRALDEAEVVDAALRLLDRGGVEAVSVRGVAAGIGVAPNTVYTYFPDKAALLRALAERVLAEVDHAAAGSAGLPWRDRVHALAADLRARLLARPGAVGLLLSAPMDGPHALALGETLLAVLGEAGLAPREAARACYLLIVQVLGSVALEVAELEEGPVPAERERVAARREALRAVPAEHFPRTAAMADTVAEYISTEQFTWSIDRVLDGLTAVRPAPTGDAPGTDGTGAPGTGTPGRGRRS
ncbi:TetR/AcrR family transcriptional regulator C-terminal domain-containing protein [Kitasatospora sp. NPDC051914]|uniref:TetR/AcrR family transcriptional regulator C-terminal domain-containing protein n=1 Tax=Kitasatospora sp. NPDC051914 TaxID=3154945 RepID=UPI0034204FDB